MRNWVFLLGLVTARAEGRARLQQLGALTRYGLWGLGLGMVLLAPLKEGSLAALWTLWLFVQYAKWLPALNLPFEDCFPAFYQQLATTFCPISPAFPANQSLYQASFQSYCSNSSLFLVNGADMFIVFFGSLLLLAIVELVALGAQQGPRLALKVAARWSILIRAVLLTELDLVVFALIQLWNVDFSRLLDILSFACAISYLFLVCLCGVLFPVLIQRNSSQIAGGKCSPALCTLINDLLPHKPALSYHYEPLLFVQRLASGLVLVLLWPYPKAQLALLASLESVVVVALGWSRPFPRLDLIGEIYPHAAGVALVGLNCLIWTESIPQIAVLIVSIVILWSYAIFAAFRYFWGFHCYRSAEEIYSSETINSSSDNPPPLTITTQVPASHRPNEAYEAVPSYLARCKAA